MNGIMVSVVVPVYNVEPYLEKCLDSLVNQTYKNYEVLLIDDGSTDSSGKICDDYVKKYPCLRVFHKENGGVSDARNYAVPYIRGSYVAYVDADDYVEPDYVLEMVEIASNDEADMIISAIQREHLDGTIIKKKKYTNEKKIFTPERALEMMCYDQIGVYSVGKLMSLEIISRFPFPNEIVFGEDLAIMYRIIGACQKIVYLDVPLYHYAKRPGSALNRGWFESLTAILDISNQLLNYVAENYTGIYASAVYRYFWSANDVYSRAFYEPNYKKLTESFHTPLIQYWPILRKDPKAPLLQKIKFGLMTFTPGLYRILRKIMRK